MSYDKDRDILKMYRYKCRDITGKDCDSKFMDQPSIKLHARMTHNLILNGFHGWEPKETRILVHNK